MRVTLIQGGGIGVDQVAAVKEILSAAGVEPEMRPETLGPEQFARVFGLLGAGA